MVFSSTGKNAGVGHDADLGGLADAQQQHEDREQRQRRGVAEQLQQRVEEVGQRPVPGDQQAEGDGGHDGDAEAADASGSGWPAGGSAAGRSDEQVPPGRRTSCSGGRKTRVDGLPGRRGRVPRAAGTAARRRESQTAPSGGPGQAASLPAVAGRRPLGGTRRTSGRAGRSLDRRRPLPVGQRQRASGSAAFPVGLLVGRGPVGQDLARARLPGPPDLVVQQRPDLVPVFARTPGRSGLARRRSRSPRSMSTICLDPAGAGAQHGDPLAQVDGLVDAVGDEDDGLAGGAAQMRSSSSWSARGSGRPARRTARPSAGRPGRRRGCGRWPRAASCRRRARADTGPRTRPGPPGPGSRGPSRPVPCGAGTPVSPPARTRRWPARCARGTARTAGRRCRGRGPGPVTALPSSRIWPEVGPGQPAEQVEEGGLAAAARARPG